MSFISVLVALLLEQARPLSRGNPVHASLRAWVRWSSRNFDAGKSFHGWLAWGFSVMGPSLFVMGVYWTLDVCLGWLAAGLWTVAVLYATLGFRQFSFHFTQIKEKFGSARFYWTMRREAEDGPMRVKFNDFTESGQVVHLSRNKTLESATNLAQRVAAIIDAAELETEHLCIACGKPGESTNRQGYVLVVCPEHAPRFMNRTLENYWLDDDC